MVMPFMETAGRSTPEVSHSLRASDILTTRSPQRESRCSLVFWQKHNLATKGLVGGDAILGTQVMSWGGLDVGCGTLSHSRWKGATVKEWARVWDPSYSVEKRTKTKAALPFNGPG